MMHYNTDIMVHAKGIPKNFPNAKEASGNAQESLNLQSADLNQLGLTLFRNNKAIPNFHIS